MVENLAAREMKKHSQNGEDGVLLALLEDMPDVPRVAVEFGVGNGVECCTRILKEAGWDCFWFDARHDTEGVRKVTLTPENINEEMDRAGVPAEIGVLSVDVDGQDYWLWRALARKSTIAICECNAYLPLEHHAVTIPCLPEFVWDGSDYAGCSLLGMKRLARAKGMGLVYCERTAVNAFFVRGVEPGDFASLYRKPARSVPKHGPGLWQWIGEDGEPGNIDEIDWADWKEKQE